MGEKHFQEFASIFSWVKNIFRNLPPFFHGSNIFLGICLQIFIDEKYFQEFAFSFFMGEKHFQEFAPNFFMGGPHVGPPTWAPRGPTHLGPGLGPGAAAGGAGAGAACAAGRILRSQPDPSPNAPRDQIRRKDPCCDFRQFGKTHFQHFGRTNAIYALLILVSFESYF